MTTATKTPDSPPRKPVRPGIAIKLEWTIALLLTAMSLAFHIRCFLKSGPLWRDEITSVNLARTHSFTEAVAQMHNDSFPILWLCVVRLWQHLGIGLTDSGMRLLGLLAGLAVLATLWRNAKRFGVNTPVVSIALLGFTTSVLCYGDSIRAYGLGMFLGLLSIGLIWDLARTPTPMRFAIALLVSLLSVHTLFYNWILLLASCCGAVALMIPKHQYKRAALIFTTGLICALSMLAYLPMLRHTRGEMMFQILLDNSRLLARIRESLQFATEGNVPLGHNDILWAIVILASLLIGLIAGCTGKLKSANPQQRDAVIFSATCLVVGLGVYWSFLKFLRYDMAPWYFLAAMAMAATCLDGLFGAFKSPPFRLLLAIGAAIFAMNSAVPLWKNTAIRKTNIDLVAAHLQATAAPQDIIVIDPWNNGPTFNRYYHGSAQWTTILPVPFSDYQKYDQIMKYLTDPHAPDPLIQKLSATLRAGHRIWLVTNTDFPTVPESEPYIQTAPDPIWGWRLWKYQNSWDKAVLFSLRQNSYQINPVPIPSDQLISHYEQVQLWRIDGSQKEN